jgi:hypothetical protein
MSQYIEIKLRGNVRVFLYVKTTQRRNKAMDSADMIFTSYETSALVGDKCPASHSDGFIPWEKEIRL